MVYLTFGTFIHLDIKVLDSLLRHGADTLYPKLMWPDKIQLLDTCNRAGVDYKMRVFNKIAIDILLQDYATLVMDMGLERLISLIMHF